MHPDIEKLINIAKESGELTDKQKEIILRKAEKLGEDVDEVELILESTSNSFIVHRNRCNNCGAIIPSLAGFCPECGMSVEKESSVAKATRSNLKGFSEKLAASQNDDKTANTSGSLSRLFTLSSSKSEIVNEIQSFSVPFTVESLTQGFNYAISNYHSLEGNDSSAEEAMAWLGKAKEFYRQIASMRLKDEITEKWLQDNKGLLKISFSQKRANYNARVWDSWRKSLVPIIILFIMFIILIML